jgi:hypothetical protein
MESGMTDDEMVHDIIKVLVIGVIIVALSIPTYYTVKHIMLGDKFGEQQIAQSMQCEKDKKK